MSIHTLHAGTTFSEWLFFSTRLAETNISFCAVNKRNFMRILNIIFSINILEVNLLND